MSRCRSPSTVPSFRLTWETSSPGGRESAVIGAPHPDFGEGVVAVVVPAGAPLGEAELRDALSGRLASFKQPKRIFFQEALPRNAMGKVRKEDLRGLYADAFESEQ